MTPQEMNILPHAQVFEWGLRSMELLNLPFPANSGKETEQKPLLSVERLHKRFGLHEVLKDVSFSCSPGRRYDPLCGKAIEKEQTARNDLVYHAGFGQSVIRRKSDR